VLAAETAVASDEPLATTEVQIFDDVFDRHVRIDKAVGVM
jgi:hypothetical protein